ncbi:MAG: PDZ domain-containing protein, partial [Alphaproteobacteria bacterium]
QTVTSGIVSAIARTSVNISDFRSFIQTDAPINPGNSGGALATLDGKLVGINTAILSRSGGNVGIGFAIPSNMVTSVVRAALSGGRIQRPTLGIGGQDVTADIARARGIDRIGGVIVSQVQPNSPATAAGIKINDIILKINGRDIADIQDLRFRVATLPVGGTVKLTLLRDKDVLELEVPLREAAATEMDEAQTLTGGHPLAGAQMVKFTAAVAERLGIRGAQRGLAIVKVAAGSSAQRRGFREKDVVLQINGVAIDSIETLRRVLEQAQGMWQIIGSRDGNLFRVFFSEQ